MTDSFISDLMSFNPQDLSAFKEPEKKENNSNIYKTNPVKFSKVEDGHYRSKVRIIYNPFDVKQSIVSIKKYSLTDADGFFIAPSKLSFNDRSCPIFTAWKKLWFDKDKDNKPFCKSVFRQLDEKYVLVQVLEDINQPELVGKILPWKLPKTVYDIMNAKMNPSEESKKKPVAIMDYLFGKPLEIDVEPGPDDKAHPERKQREISYSLCAFDGEGEPIIKVDGTPLFTEAELQLIEEYTEAKSKYEKTKTEADKAKKLETIQALVPQVKELYAKALDYLKENSLDIVEECGYKEWNEYLTERVKRWISIVLQGIDPATYTADNPILSKTTEEIVADAQKVEVVNATVEDDLPF